MNSIKIAIVGTGLIGPRHARAALHEPEAKLTCIVDPNHAAIKVADQLGTTWYSSIQEMVVSPDKPDAAVVCTPNHTHVAVSKELLDAGIHVLVEKPVSGDLMSGRKLIAHAESRKLSLLVGHHRRFNQYIIATKKLLSNNDLGRIIAISGLWTTLKPQSYFDPPSEWRRSSSGGPVLINLIHEVDILQFLLGPIVRVYAEKAVEQRGFEAEEGGAITLRFENGVVGTFLLSDAVPSAHNFESGTGENPMIPFIGKDVYRIFGSKASLSVPDMVRSSYDGRPNESWTEEMHVQAIKIGDYKPPFELQMSHLVAVVKGTEMPVCTGIDGLRAVAVCAAIKEAMDSGLPVDVAF